MNMPGINMVGNHLVMIVTEKEEILRKFDEKAEKGEMVTASDIYMLLARHKWRMVMPRGKHPKKVSDEEIESSIMSVNIDMRLGLSSP